VLRAHGVKGALRIRASEALTAAEALFLDGESFAVESIQRDKEDFLVRLSGIVDRSRAEAQKGRAVSVDRALIPVDENEIFVADLVGCSVVDKDGAPIGEVVGSFDSGAHEVLVVSGARGQELMIPFVDAIIVSVDLEVRRIVCDPPEGLFE
jgi:16S rRNA processing protein RimM